MIIVAERINATRKEIGEAIQTKNKTVIVEEIRKQDEAGAHYIDLNASTGAGNVENEIDDMKWLIDLALEHTEKYLALDAGDETAMHKAAEYLGGKRSWLMNSIKGSAKALSSLLPVAADYRVPFIALAMDDEGIPQDAASRVAICERIHEQALRAGISEESIVFDPLVLPISADINQGSVTLETIQSLKRHFPKAHSIVGLSNISHGLPKRSLVNQAFLIAAVSFGLEWVICDPTDAWIRQGILLGELVSGKDRHCRRFTPSHPKRKSSMKNTNTMGEDVFRQGTIVAPVERLNKEQIQVIHNASLEVLNDPGIICFNEEAVSVFEGAGCRTEFSNRDNAWTVRIPDKVITQALESAPSQIVLGAREPANRLVIDAAIPRVYFGTGSETNIVLETEMVDFVAQNDPGLTARSPVYHERRGTVSRLCYSARLCEALNNVDFYIRNVNVQDETITPSNKDVNVFFGSLLYMTKHVQAGLVELSSIDSLVRLGELLTGGSDAFQDNPLISFIACLIKSPLQMVEDTTQKVIEIAKRGLPLVISSSPQGGSTAPIQEEGMVILINAEILAGMTLAQLVNPGTPLLYGAVPVRARLDNLHDFYGAPEFVHYNIDCAQMARFYQVPCYSTAGVGDSKVPGMQATVEKVFSQLAVAQSGAQYIHYALGLLDRTSIFCPVQAIIDDANISLVREVLRQPTIDGAAAAASVEEIGKVLSSSTRLFARHIRKQMRRGVVSQPYALQGDGNHDEILQNACNRLNEIQEMPDKRLPAEIIDAIYEEIPGLLSREHFLL